MNDRFRFRVWDKDLDIYLTMGDWIWNSCYSGDAMVEPHMCVIEQCTGLKDKNGKLIFEGDRLELYKRDNGKVLWHLGGFFIRYPCSPSNHCLEHLSTDWARQSKVIGNIHKNPELLEKNNGS